MSVQHVLDCMGKCIVDQEEYLVSTNLILLNFFFNLISFQYEGTDYYRATYRWCQNGTENGPSRLHPDRLMDAYIQTQDMQICKEKISIVTSIVG